MNDTTPDDACWEWTGATDKDGYGVKTVKGKQYRVHRLAYAKATGEDPGNLMVRHSCDNPPCYRPSHLRLGTAQDNADDKVSRDRCRNQYNDATHCIHNHEFTAENTYVNPSSGSRQCRTCRRLMNKLEKKISGADPSIKSVIREVFWERAAQELIWGPQDHPVHTDAERDGVALTGRSYAWSEAHMKERFASGPRTGAVILLEEVFEALAAPDLAATRDELVQVAAVAVMLVEGIDRARTAGATAADRLGLVRPCEVVASELVTDPHGASADPVVPDSEAATAPVTHDHGNGPRPCMCGATGQAARCTTPETHNWGCGCPADTACAADGCTPDYCPGGKQCWVSATGARLPADRPDADTARLTAFRERLSAGTWTPGEPHRYNGAGRLHGICRCGEDRDAPVHRTGSGDRE